MDPAVVVSFFITLLLELGFPLLVAWFLVRRYHLSWTLFLYGALFFILVQMIHTPLVLFTQAPLSAALNAAIPNRTFALAVFAVILGSSPVSLKRSAATCLLPVLPVPEHRTSRENGLLFRLLRGWRAC